MKYAIFGTGTYYNSLKKYFHKDDILFFLDNNIEKQGTYVDEIKVLNPEQVDYTEVDYIVVLIMRCDSILKQLLSYGITRNKIILPDELAQIVSVDSYVHTPKGQENIADWVHSGTKPVLLLLHEFTRNGVAVVMMNMANVLKNMEYDVLVGALVGGVFEEELKEKGLDYITDVMTYYKSKEFSENLPNFEFIVLSTIGLADVGREIMKSGTHILWWLHESNDENYRDFDLPVGDNIHYYGVGKRVIKKFKELGPDCDIGNLLYCIPDDEIKKIKNEKLRIGVIGFVNKRKAQDVFVKAIQCIESKYKEKAVFEIVGKITEPIINLDELEKGIHYVGELTQVEIREYYKSLDLLICPSRDDPMPVVVTQAMQYGIPCIVSDEVGQSEFISDGENGFVFKSEDVNELSEKITYCIANKDTLTSVGNKAKDIYLNLFSENKMKAFLTAQIEKICKVVK